MAEYQLETAEIADAIRVRHLLTPISRAVGFDPAASEHEVIDVLRSHDFDIGPVWVNGVIVGFVRAADLDSRRTDPIEPRFRRLDGSVLVRADATVGKLMGWLQERPFLFVVDRNEVVGLVTPSDMNKQPGRVYFYLLIADLEVLAAQAIRTSYTNQEDALSKLSRDQRRKAARLLAAQRDGDVEADAVAVLDFGDLLAIIGATPELRSIFAPAIAEQWDARSRELRRLRNDVMHMGRSLATDRKSSLERLTRLDGVLHAIISGFGRV